MKKRIATFLILMMAFGTTLTFAKQPVPASKAVSQSVGELVKSKIDYPDFARITDFECCALVRLYINEDGTFDVDCINCKDSQLKMHVKEKIEKIISEEHAQFAGQTVSLNVVFKLID